jgi:LPPG:FO 2-phospho-L-lactate transferase
VILALAGGVGGARLASGFAAVLAADELTIAVNVGDDFEHLGLAISPDIDTVMYTLAGLQHPVNGWGRFDETWNFMGTLADLGGETWFRLGDRDLAVHVERTRQLRAGRSLSDITAELCGRLGIRHSVLPATDASLRTMVDTDAGELAFQDYFVRRRCEPAVRGFRFAGAADAAPAAPLAKLLESGIIEAIVICPSNPWLSVAPMLAIAPLREFLASKRVPVVAVSPIVAGAAVKGPAAKIMRELGVELSALGVVRHYGALVDGWVVDSQDAALAPAVEAIGCKLVLTDTMMTAPEKTASVARVALDLARRIGASR